MILWRAVVALVVLAGTVFAAVRLKSRIIDTENSTSARPKEIKTAAALLAPQHRIVEFAAFPSPAQVLALEGRGAYILHYVPDNALLVRLDPGTDLEGVGARWMGELEPADKVSPALNEISELTAVVVEFHPDTDPIDARWAIVSSRAEIIWSTQLAPNHMLVRADAAAMERLAARDEVAYIFPAASSLERGETTAVCQGAASALGATGQYASNFSEGWDGPGLGSTALAFFLSNGTDRLPDYVVQTEIMRALATWSKYVKVDFSPGRSPASDRTINILFGSREHGDGYPFDGPGGMLAHTFFPAPINIEPIAGDVHLDGDEGWRVGAYTDLFSVALHELGHALGLGHSDQKDAVMYPYYRLVSDLAQPDIDAIRELYAATDPTPAEPTDPPSNPTTPGNGAPGTPPPSSQPAGGTPAGPAPPTNPTTPRTPSSPADKPSAGPDTTAPVLVIRSPGSVTSITTAAAVTVSGIATDSGGVQQIVWLTTAGDSGIANGTTQWQAGPIPLYTGTNTIIIRAFDATGNMAWKSLVITCRGI